MYHPAELHVTGPQLVKLWHGHPVQIKHEHLVKPTSNVLVHPLTAKKIHSARMKGKGVRISLSKHEISHMNGKGFWSDAWNYLKKKVPEVAHWVTDTAVPWIKNNIIDSELYQEKIKPIVHEKVKDKLESMPYANYTVPAAEWIEGQTGLGLKKHHKRAKPAAKRITGASFRV